MRRTTEHMKISMGLRDALIWVPLEAATQAQRRRGGALPAGASTRHAGVALLCILAHCPLLPALAASSEQQQQRRRRRQQRWQPAAAAAAASSGGSQQHQPQGGPHLMPLSFMSTLPLPVVMLASPSA